VLLELADELAGDLASEELEALQNILRARRKGLHLLRASDRLFAALASVASLPEPDRAILEKSRGQQVQKKALFRAVQRRVLVSRDAGPSLEPDGGRETAIVPLRHFAPFSVADCAFVLGEGEPDARMAVRMARYFAHTRGLERLPLPHHVAVGGGGGTSIHLRLHRERPCFCIGVVDGDRAAPGCKEGRTAVEARREVDDAKPWVGLHVLACREMENTLPSALMEAAYRDYQQKRRALDDLERFDEGGALARYRDYCDFKHGTQLKWVLEHEEEEAKRFWLAPDAPLTAAPSVNEGCLAQRACPKGKNCTCVLATGVDKKKLLETCVNAAEEMPDHELEELLCEKTEPHWRALGRTVFSWVCGTGETRV